MIFYCGAPHCSARQFAVTCPALSHKARENCNNFGIKMTINLCKCVAEDVDIFNAVTFYPNVWYYLDTKHSPKLMLRHVCFSTVNSFFFSREKKLKWLNSIRIINDKHCFGSRLLL